MTWAAGGKPLAARFPFVTRQVLAIIPPTVYTWGMKSNGLTWVTIPQAARRTGVPLRTVYRWAYHGRVPYRQAVRTEGYSTVALENVQRLAQEREARRADR